MPVTGYVMKKPQRRLQGGFPQRLARPRAGMVTTSPRRGIFREYRWYKTVAVACCLVPSDSHCVIGSWRILRDFRSEVLGTGAEFSPAEGTANTNKL